LPKPDVVSVVVVVTGTVTDKSKPPRLRIAVETLATSLRLLVDVKSPAPGVPASDRFQSEKVPEPPIFATVIVTTPEEYVAYPSMKFAAFAFDEARIYAVAG
jgi:hypothetical protein